MTVSRPFPSLRTTRLLKVIAFVQDNFLGAMLREKQNAKMRFEFPQQDGKTLAQMFGFIEVRRNGISTFAFDYHDVGVVYLSSCNSLFNLRICATSNQVQ